MDQPNEQAEQSRGNVPEDSSAAEEAKAAVRAERIRQFKWLAVMAVSFVVWAAYFGFFQESREDALAEPVPWRSRLWWLRPVEVNAAERLPTVPIPLNKIYFRTNGNGWALGNGGMLLKSSDAGKSWHAQMNIDWNPAMQPGSRGAMGALEDVYFLDDNRGWVLRGFGGILETSDGGASWILKTNIVFNFPPKAPPYETPEQQKKAFIRERLNEKSGRQEMLGGGGGAGAPPPNPSKKELPDYITNLECIWFVSPNTGWMVEGNGRIWHSTNAGTSWHVQYTLPETESFWPITLKFADENHGWIGISGAGGNGEIWRTVNGGMDWEINEFTDSSCQKFNFLDSQRAWVLTTTNLLYTADGGGKWSSVRTFPPYEYVSLAFLDEKEGWIGGMDGKVARTRNGGESWEEGRIETYSQIIDLQIADRDKAVALGQNGALFYSTDDGKKWQPANKNAAGAIKALHFVDEMRGLAIRENKVIQTLDGGRTWRTRANLDERLTAIYFTSQTAGWIGGEKGGLYRTQNGGETWQKDESNNLGRISHISFYSPSNGTVSGYEMLRTTDGGNTWISQWSTNQPHYVQFVDEMRGWGLGRMGEIFWTTNGGTLWEIKTNALSHLYRTNSARQLHALYFVNPRFGMAVGDGVMMRTADGGETWTTEERAEWLEDLKFVDENRGWVVGDDGVILKTTDGGLNWLAQTSNVSTTLNTVFFLDDQRGWAGGDAGTVLRTVDGGLTWEKAEYSRKLAPLAYLLLLPIFGLVIPVWPRDLEIKAKRGSIAERFISDVPLQAGEKDFLGTRVLAGGLFNYLRNPRTKGPLVLAVTGEWGAGKSSVVFDLYERMREKDFYPVLFNAWHHQQEEDTMAALLESIRRQAIPPWLSLKGARYRGRLIMERLSRKWKEASLIAFCTTLAITFLNNTGLQKIDPSSWDKLFEGLIENLKFGGSFALLAPLLLGLVKLFKSFGVDPAALLRSSEGKTKDLRAKTSFRHQFAKEFGEVSEALQPQTLTIFIDDLDRCKSDHMMDVLEIINFLISSGPCFVVLSMEEKVVKSTVAEKVQMPVDLERAKSGQEPTMEERLAYAEKWMQKLIQVKVQTPKGVSSQFKALLTGVGDQKNGSRKNGENKNFGTMPARFSRWLSEKGTQRIFKGIGITATTLALMWVGLETGDYLSGQLPGPKATTALPGTATNTQALSANEKWRLTGSWTGSNIDLFLSPAKTISGPTNVASNESSMTSNMAPTNARALRDTNGAPVPRSPRSIATMAPGQSDGRAIIYAIAIALVSIGAGAFILKRRPFVSFPDSPIFESGLEKWAPLIEAKHQTPRAIKRFVNKVRFYAMLVRNPEKPEEEAQLPEDMLVGFGALEDFCPDLLATNSVSAKDLEEAKVPAALVTSALEVIKLSRSSAFEFFFHRYAQSFYSTAAPVEKSEEQAPLSM